MVRGRCDGWGGEGERLGLVVRGEATVADVAIVNVAVLELVNGSLLRAAVLVVALPADEEESEEREYDQANHAADHTTNDRADIC